jgi:diaminohydroxyphosphoribosylaminopyrimidine deaminase/5-amino-6-(5-phosphoribosylamino)uracil reductase
MRANATTLLTTANTVLADNPSLTVRHPLWQKQSTVVILDTHARLSKAITQATHTLFQQDYPQTVFWLTGAHTHSCLEPIQHSLPKHVRWFSIPTELTTKGQPCLALHKVMNLLHQHEQQSVWVEAGGTLATQLLEAQLVDDVYLIQSTQLVGDRYAPHWLGELSGALTHRVSEAMRPLSFVHSQPFGTDAILHLRPHHNPLRIPKLQSAGSLDFRSDPFLKEIPCTT